MSDVFSPEMRSRVMASIRGKNTKEELCVRRFLFRQGLRFRVNDSRLPGKPDIVLPKYRTVVFLNGCFWHGHGCAAFRMPSTNREFWETKIRRNKERDERNVARLLSMGYRVIVVWECELRGKQKREATLNGLLNEIWDA
ncbi:MAG: DNA mismatch endonuclease Vsr [Sphaerochaeta sp.]|nr:DNA mismatch endonuclease Vsr [Sphaerochaeta sp.]